MYDIIDVLSTCITRILAQCTLYILLFC